MYVKLNSQEEVGEFVNAVMHMNSKVRIHALNAIVDASSIMGILTLNLSEPIYLICDDETEAREAIDKFIVEV